MSIELLVDVLVPIAVIIMMATVGLNLGIRSLVESLRRPRSVVICTLAQIVLLPALAVALVALLGAPALIATVMFAVSISPGGTLSNAFTHLVGGNLGLSVVLTVLSTMLVPLTAPAAVGVVGALGLSGIEASGQLSPIAIARELMLVSLLPICAGVLVAHLLPNFARRIRPAADIACAIALLVIIGSSVIVSWPAVQHSAAHLFVFAAALSLASLLTGAAVATALPHADRSACVIELGVRNLPIALMLAGGAAPSPEIVAFLLVYFLINTMLLLTLAQVRKTYARRSMA